MNRPVIVLAIVALLSACVAEEDPNTTLPASQQSSASPTSGDNPASDNSSANDESVSSADNGVQSSSAVSSAGVDESSSASSEAESSASTSSESVSSAPGSSSASSLVVSSARSLAASSRSSVAQESSSSLSSSQSSSSSSSQSSSEPAVSLVARDLHYSVDLGGSLSVDADDGVMSNDDVAPGVYVEIVSAPEQGNLTLNADGSFVYTSTGAAVVDYFHYRLTDGDNSDTAEVSISIRDPISGSNGFTPITPSEDSRIIYVSSSDGNDNNDCLSPAEPCATFAESIQKMREGFPDHLYLKRGDVWRNEELTDVPSGRSVSEPAVVAFYGESGARPKIESDHIIYRPQGRQVEHIWFIGLHFHAYKMDPGHSEFIGGDNGAAMRFIAKFNDILVEDSIYDYIDLTIEAYNGNRPSNFIIRRNIFQGGYAPDSSYANHRSSAMYVHGVDGLTIEENVFDEGGWDPSVEGAGANTRNHNVYIQYSVDPHRLSVNRNIVTRGSSHGLMLRPGGTAIDNFLARNAVSLLGGTTQNDYQYTSGDPVHFHNNVISEGQSMHKGIDHCQGAACSSALFGLHIKPLNMVADFDITNNIVTGLSPEETQPLDALTRRSLHTDYTEIAGIADTITWEWESSSEGHGPDYVDPGRTLADYYQSIGGEHDFDAFMQEVKNRPLQTWNKKYTATAINDYIRAGFEIQ